MGAMRRSVRGAAPPGRRPRTTATGPRIVYEDADLVVADKPPGLLTIATAREKDRTLYAWLRARLARKRPPELVFVVHRLDRDVSGLILFAKSAERKEELQLQFRERRAERVYLALVEGSVREDAFTVRSYLAENAAFRVYTTKDERRGKLAVTHVRVLARSQGRSLVEVRLDTGRKHQIRVHLADAGHPIVGDRRYGRAERGTRRIALHASRLRFTHPRSGEVMEFASGAPGWAARGDAASSPGPRAHTRPRARRSRRRTG